MPGATAIYLVPTREQLDHQGADFASNSRITPFESHPVQGVVDRTYITVQAYPPVELT